jgi:signal transduction histidine kinase
MNSLLKRQLEKKLKGSENDLNPFLDAIDESYKNYESQIDLLQRAMKISSDELFDANQKLRAEAESLKDVNKNLEFILNSMNLEMNINTNAHNLNPSEYIKQQSIVIVDINKQREQLLANLEKQNKALNEYAHMVSHDLKAPLRSIDALLNWFIEDNGAILDDKNKKSLQLILSNVEKMDLLIKGILDYSSIDNQDIVNRNIDLNLLMEDIFRTIFIPDHVTIQINNKLPRVFGNDFRFKQLFQNLIQNAIKYNNKEKAIIEIGSEENEEEIKFYIKDNGIGIPEKYKDKIFDIFSKLENNDHSTGIGLSIVKKIVDLYKGKIWLESQENIGTTFYFTILKENGAA